MRSWIAAALAATLLGPAASAQTGPTASGSLELQFGIATIALPEDTEGTYSAQPQLRLGLFLSEALQFQVEGYARVWPLGAVAPSSYGVVAQVAWYPSVGPNVRGLYFLAGAGGALNEPPGFMTESSFDPLVRGGLGYRVPLNELGVGFLTAAHLNAEYRAEYLLEDPSDFVSGVAVSFSYFL
ncbi:MAG: hypothetical protein HKN12_10830 [Gemmatimonadetes bacterium]|nr:hypothetical protein [Gemmatimonadota bacterium]